MSRFVIDQEFDINAPAEVVWQVLTDFERYGEWNPFVVQAACDLRPGGAIDMKVKLLGPAQRQVEYIHAVDPGKGFSYNMKPFPLGGLSSFRSHKIIDLGDGRSHYSSHFHLEGWMMPIVRGLMSGALLRGFSGMSDALKLRAEALHAK